MLTIFFSVTIKPECEVAFLELAERLTKTTHAEDKGCIAYTFFRQTDDALKVTLFEQWADGESLSAHIGRLLGMLGPPDDDPDLPENHVRRRLPKAFMDLFADSEVTRYTPLFDGASHAT